MSLFVDGSAEKPSSAAFTIIPFEDPTPLARRPSRTIAEIDVDPAKAGFYRKRGKRLFDIVVSALMLLAAAPILLALMLVVALAAVSS